MTAVVTMAGTGTAHDDVRTSLKLQRLNEHLSRQDAETRDRDTARLFHKSDSIFVPCFFRTQQLHVLDVQKEVRLRVATCPARAEHARHPDLRSGRRRSDALHFQRAPREGGCQPHFWRRQERRAGPAGSAGSSDDAVRAAARPRPSLWSPPNALCRGRHGSNRETGICPGGGRISPSSGAHSRSGCGAPRILD